MKRFFYCIKTVLLRRNTTLLGQGHPQYFPNITLFVSPFKVVLSSDGFNCLKVRLSFLFIRNHYLCRVFLILIGLMLLVEGMHVKIL